MVSLAQVRLARTLAHVLVYMTLAVGATLSIQVTVAVVDQVLPYASWKVKMKIHELVKVYHVAQLLLVMVTPVLFNDSVATTF